MDIDLAKADLARALKFAQRASDPKSPFPVLTCLHVRAAWDKRLYVEGSDLNTTAGVHVDLGEQREGGEALLPGLFADFAGMMPEGMVSLTVRGHVGATADLASVAEKRRYSAMTIPAHDWPADRITRQESPPAPVLVPIRPLLDALLAAIPVAGEDETKPANAILVRLFGGRLEVVSTDGSRLQIHRQDLTNYPGAFRLVTAKRNMRLLRRMLEDNLAATDATLTVDDKTFRAVAADYTLQGRTFPEWIPFDQVLQPLAWGTRMRFNREAFVSMIDACALESTFEMVLSIRRDGTVKIGAKVDSKIQIIDEVTPGDVVGMVAMPKGVDSFELGVNPRYLREAFNAIPEKDEDAVLCFHSPMEPLIVTRTNTDFEGTPANAMHLTVVMPMKL